VFAGLWGAVYGSGLLRTMPASGSFDSHVRYLSGLLLGLGLVAWSCVPQIEERGGRLGLVALVVVIGGLARIYGTPVTGYLSPFIFLPLLMELVVTPALWLWQRRVARKMRNAGLLPPA
jgi:branched-subunit amino acid ABC-type transport system permease component